MEKVHGLFASGCLLVVLLILDTAHKEVLLDASAEFTLFLQGISAPITNSFFKFVDVFSLWLVVLIPLFSLSKDGLKVGLPVLAIAAISSAVNNVAKMAVGEERPYWAYGNIQAIKCSMGYGFPSGHSMLAGSTYGMYAYFAFKKGNKALAWTLIDGIFIVAIDRLYLGVHSLNQVVIGLTVAAVTIAGMSMMKLHRNSSLTKHSIGSHVFAFAVIFLAWLVSLSEPNWDPDWSIYISEKCGKEVNGQRMFEFALKSMPVVFILPGLFLGLVLYKRETDSIKHWTSVSTRNGLVRFGFTVCVVLLITLLNWALKKVASDYVVGVALAIFIYAGGVAIGYVTPKIIYFKDSEMQQKLIEP